MSEQVEVAALPTCDICDDEAHYDAKTSMGPWAFMCEAHYKRYRRYETLGTGKGQRLVAAETNTTPSEPEDGSWQ